MASVTLKDIMKEYDNGVVAVRDFNLQIEDREFIVLVGPSGCGKSTALRMIAGLEDITQGELYIDDRQVNNVNSKDRNIAMVFQNYALYPHMNVFQNMEFGLKMRKVKKSVRKVKIEETAKMLQIEELLQRKPAQLSGGQRQRAALGRAMVRDPKLFLLDEPLSNLDAKLRTEMRVTIGKLHRQINATFIYVTHDQTEAMTMADRIVVMRDGYIQQVDTPRNIYNQPANLFVAKFIGSPQINTMHGIVVKRDGRYILTMENEDYELPEKRFENCKLDHWLNKGVTAALRPEDIRISSPGHLKGSSIDDDRTDFPAIVELAEGLGSETYVYLSAAGEKLSVKIPAQQDVRPGDKVLLSFNMERVHLFDEETGINITIP